MPRYDDKITVETEVRHNGNPNNGPIGPAGYTASFAYQARECPQVLGCPLGRGHTRERAVMDLLERANAESGTSFTMSDVKVDYR